MMEASIISAVLPMVTVMNKQQFKNFLLDNPAVKADLASEHFQASNDKRSTFVRTENSKLVEFLRYERGFKVLHDGAFLIKGLKPYEVDQCFWHKKITDSVERLKKIAKDNDFELEYRYNDGIYQCCIGPLEFYITYDLYIQVTFAGSLMNRTYCHESEVGLLSQAMSDTAYSFDYMFYDVHCILEKEYFVQQERQKNSDLISLIKSLLNSFNCRLDFKASVLGFDYDHPVSLHLAIEDAQFFKFNGIEYQVNRKDLGSLAVGLYQHLESKGYDLSKFKA